MQYIDIQHNDIQYIDFQHNDIQHYKNTRHSALQDDENCYAECHSQIHYVECRYAERRYPECRGAERTVRRETAEVKSIF